MYSRLLKPELTKSFFVFGPRGTGKSFWVQKNYPKALVFDLLESEIYQKLLAHPQRLEGLIPIKFKGYIVIDEVQKVPALLDEVHRLIEKKKYKFILTGSSARKLRKSGVNLLAGRAYTYYMYPLTCSELGEHFNLKHALMYGMLPSVWIDQKPQKYLSSYVQTYLREEVLQEGLTRNLAAFSRFLEVASFSQGSLLNMTEVAREANVERKVIENYFSILRDLLLSIHLPVFTKRAKRRMVAHQKFYYYDVGLFRALRPLGPLDAPSEIDGPALETLFLQELIALNHYYELGYKIHFWRTANGEEIDFILYGSKGLIAFEIKRSSRITSKDLTPLKLFLKDYPMAKVFLLYGGTTAYHETGIEIKPYEKVLKNLISLLNVS